MREALRSAKLFVVDEALDPDLGVTSYISRWGRRHGIDPTFLFTAVAGSRMPLVMNLLKRGIVLAGLGLEDNAQAVPALASRFRTPGTVIEEASRATLELSSLADLPLLRHQPRDVGKYLTSFVGALVDTVDGSTNLGFYRGQVVGERDIVLFMDPRTDAHRIATSSLEQADEVPITLFNGGPISTYVAAAAKLPGDLDSYEASSRLGAAPVAVASAGFPPAPSEAEIVLHGFVTRELRAEAPFGEFKGYYCGETRSPLVRVERITIREDGFCLGLFCGKESGLTLMSLQNEILLHDHLQQKGFDLSTVRYPLGAFGEYAAIIETERPSREMVRAALDYDKRSKLIVALRPGADVFKEAAIFAMHAETRPYMRYGRQEGDRVGLVCDRTHEYEWVEL